MNEFTGKSHRASAYFDSVQAEHAKHTRQKSPYIVSIPMQARALMRRRVQILRGGIAVQVIQLLSFIIQGIIVGTVFLQLQNTTTSFFSRGGVIFLYVYSSLLRFFPWLIAMQPIARCSSPPCRLWRRSLRYSPNVR